MNFQNGNFPISENEFDVLLVDESHRLNAKSGMFKNQGENISVALETAIENFSEERGIFFGSKSPFPFAEVLALRMSEFREKSTLVIESFFHKPEITKNQ